ncbi:hypothetical protein BH23PLA1_BH23PLA1_32810 [soil metagenome]
MAAKKAATRTRKSTAQATPTATAKTKTKTKTKKKATKATTSRIDNKARFTTNHRVIQKWVEERGGKPATVKGTRRKGDPVGLLRIDFPGYSGEQTLKEISWDEFFAKFEESDLAFLYQNQTATGAESRFSKLIALESAKESDAIPVGESGGRSSRPAHKAKTTTSHRVIRRWVEERGGKPATVKGTRRKGDPVGLLRIDFPGYSGEQTLKEIPWEDFFAKFDENGLIFLYQDQTSDGQTSRFNRFITWEADQAPDGR